MYLAITAAAAAAAAVVMVSENTEHSSPCSRSPVAVEEGII